MSRNLLALSVALSGGVRVLAQSNTFFWGFHGSDTLPECGNVGISILTNGAGTPVAPFTLLSYEVGGPTHVSPLVGSDNSNLQWTVPHAAGKQVILQVADAAGNSGGVTNKLYSIASGSSSSCHTDSTPSITLTTSNTSLTTCDPLVLELDGGQKPYSLTVVAINSGAPTNITMGPSDNQYTYINRQLPSSSPLLVAAHDATGQYAINTGVISLTGGNDITCPGKNDVSNQRSSTSTSTTTTSATPKGTGTKTKTSTSSTSTGTASSDTSSGSHTAVIAGAAAAAVVVIAALGAVVFFFYWRKRRNDSSVGSANTFNKFFDGKPPPGPVVQPYADESFGNRPQTQYDVNQYAFAPGTAGSGGAVHLQYAPPGRAQYDTMNSSRTNLLQDQPGTPPLSGGYNPYTLAPNQVQQPYPPYPHPYAYNSPSPGAAGSFGAQQQQSQPFIPPQRKQQQQPLPASVAYAQSRQSQMSAPSDITATSSSRLLPTNYDEEESELAYRNSGGSDYNAWAEQPRNEKSAPVNLAGGKQVLQHRDAGPVEEVPPAYGDRG